MEQFPIVGWVRLLVTLIVFVASCTSLGYFAGVWSRRYAQSRKACVLVSVAIACIWPVILIADCWYVATTCLPNNLDKVCDAPIYALIGAIFLGGPILFIISLALVLPIALRKRRSGLS